MALDLKLQVNASQDCNSLFIEDITGPYSVSNNPGGWGGFNIDGNRDNYNLIIHLTVYHFIDGKQYSSSITLPYFTDYVVYPTGVSHRGFKVSIPASDIYSDISLLPGIPEEFDPVQEFLEDTLYKVTIQISSSNISSLVPSASDQYSDFVRDYYLQQFDFKFNNTCMTQKAVDKYISTVNLGCEDCDDEDLDKALLAKNLLETLKRL
tara:strand:- start:2196 stop:2819 length:624 start_codon:yes stop_codon:yes gene_type:complete